MIYTVSNIIGACKGVSSTNNKLKLGIDLTIIALLVISDVCIPKHGRLSSGLISFAVVLAGADCISLILRKILLGNFFISQRDHFRSIILANQHAVSEEAALAARGQPYHQILGNLCLGNAEGFLQTTSTIPYRNPGGPGDTYGLNPGQFTTVITACNIRAIEERISYSNVQADFATDSIEWYFVGQTWEDAPDHWKVKIDEHWWSLVHDCTWSKKEILAADYVETENVRCKNISEKIKKLEDSHPKDWFEPIFQVMDKAVEGRKTLLHCHAGISKSASILVAFLINRFGVSAERAVTFLKNRRACVQPKFMEQLKNYERNLRAHQFLRTHIPDELKALNILRNKYMPGHSVMHEAIR